MLLNRTLTSLTPCSVFVDLPQNISKPCVDVVKYRGLTKKKTLFDTGMDPAGPWFEEKDSNELRLDATDALLVDVIHTNGEPGLLL